MLPYKDPQKRKAYQKEYNKTYVRNKEKDQESKKKRRAKIAETISKAKDNPCKKCGKRFTPKAMDFHHRKKEDKLFSIGNAQRLGPSLKKLEEEIAKCDLVCKICHVIIEEELSNNNPE